MANDPTSICNLALTWLGQNVINDLGENQKEAIVMNANFIPCRDKVLEDRPWGFATERAILIPKVGSPAWGEENLFEIPSNVIRPWRCYASPTSRKQAVWYREGRNILSEESKLYAYLIYRIENTDFFSPTFAYALAARLAADTCITFTESRTLADDMEKKYDKFLFDAAATDGQQGRSEVIQSDKLTGARRR